MRERLFGALGLGKPREGVSEKAGPKATSWCIEIGNSFYLLSSKVQKNLEVDSFSDYPKSKSVLIIQEAHSCLEGQFNLYKGLEVLFRDNPQLLPKTVFLAEGFPANQPLSVRPLIEVEPNPDDELIWEVLSTFLITGYMAYEWKYQLRIPIIGIEDPILYRISSKLMATLEDDRAAALWPISMVARNKSIAITLLEQTKRYENPVLFVGGGHLEKLPGIKPVSLEAANLRGFLTPEEMQRLKDWQDLGVRDYLAKEKIGYIFLLPRYYLEKESNKDTYRSLFRAQQDGSYDEYLARQISERISSTTTRPSPEAAAKFLKSYLAARPDNPKAREAANRGFALTGEGKYAEAAEEFSAASAAEPGNPGHVTLVQESAFKEFGSRVTYVLGGSKTKSYTLNPSIEPDLQILGPYIRKDHVEKVVQFAQRFAQTPGVQEVIDNAKHRYWETRFGGILQADAAQVLGPEGIRAFEERHGKGRVDIATKDNIAIECKNIGSLWVRLREIEKWVGQAVTRFEPDEKGHQYNGVLIVIPNHSNLEEIQLTVNAYLELNNPKVLGKIKVSKVADLKDNLYQLTKR